MSNDSFDLLMDDWIPCLVDSAIRPKSIRAALEGAGTIRSIEHGSPPVRIAVLRLLMAFCYRVAAANDCALSSFRSWKTLRSRWSDGVPGEWIDRYLDDCKCRGGFRLFDADRPFFQVANLQCQGGQQPEPATRLFFEQFAGTPTSLWEHLPELPRIRDAALYLIACQAFGASASNTSDAKVGGLDYSPTGRTFAPCYTGYVVWLEGGNLLETLLLNLVDNDFTDADVPSWESPLTIHALRARQPQKAKQGDLDKQGRQIKLGKKIGNYGAAVPTGPVQLFTWPARSVLLTKPANGAVKTVHFTQGLALADHATDPMKPYGREGRPVALQRRKAAWRDLHAILSLAPNKNRTVLALAHSARADMGSPVLNIAGVARGDEAAKILLWRHERMPIASALLSDVNLIERLGSLLEAAERADLALLRRTERLARLYLSPSAEDKGGRRPDPRDVAKLVDDVDPRPAYWARLERHFTVLVEALPDDWDAPAGDWKQEGSQRATRSWRERVKREAWVAMNESVRALGTTARAIQAVARIRTDFSDHDLRPPPKGVPKAKRKKGRAGE